MPDGAEKGVDSTSRIVVVGAGISGLACALDLLREGRDVLVLESEERAGGVVGTIEVDGYRFETGPNTIAASSEHFRRLCADLGIAERLIASRPEAKLRYLYHRGRLRRLPAGAGGFCITPLLSAGAKLRILAEPFRRHSRVADEEEEPTLEAFLTDRVGREATRTLAGAFVRGVYAAEIGQLGARSAFPRVWRLANEHGGLVRGRFAQWRTRPRARRLPGPRTIGADLLSFPTGLHELTDALATRLGRRVRMRAPVRGLERTATGWSAALDGGERVAAEAVVLAVPAPAAYRLLAPHGDFAHGLREIEHAAVTVVHLGLRITRDRTLPPGFGFLVPPDADPVHDVPEVLGTLFTSNLFPGRAPDGGATVTSIFRTGDVEGLDRKGLLDRAGRDLALALGCPEPAEVVTMAIRRWKDVIPRYGVGYGDRIREVEAGLAARLPGITLAGSYLRGVSVEECIGRGRAVADDLLRVAAGRST